MSEPTTPFSRMDVDILSILPMLSHSTAHVYMVLGAFEADPIAPSQNDLMRYARVSRPSVSEALQFLCTHELARCFTGEDGVLRYRSIKYFHYGAREPVSVRDRVFALVTPVSADRGARQALSQPATDVKKFFTSPPIITIDSSLSFNEKEINKNKNSAVKKILRDAGIFGKVLQEPFVVNVSENTAKAWADWIAAYTGKSNPQGIAINALRENAEARPYVPPETQPQVTRGGYELNRLERQCGTMAHRLWAPWNGGCESCGIPPRERNADE